MKKTRVRLKEHEAIALGLTGNKSDGQGSIKYRLDPEQMFNLNKLRYIDKTDFKEVKRTTDKNGQVISKVEKLTAKDLISIPENHQIKRVSTNVSTQQQWVITEPIKEEKIEQEIGIIPISSNPADSEAMALIREAAELLKVKANGADSKTAQGTTSKKKRTANGTHS
jgi:hypothetical protein